MWVWGTLWTVLTMPFLSECKALLCKSGRSEEQPDCCIDLLDDRGMFIGGG